MKTNSASRWRSIVRWSTTCLLLASSVLGAPVENVRLEVLPPTAFVMPMQPGLSLGSLTGPLSSLLSANAALAGDLLKQGPVVVVETGPGVMLVPQVLRKGSQALLIPHGGAPAGLVPVTLQAAAALQEALAKGDVVSAYQTLGRSFDASVMQADDAAGGNTVTAPVGTPVRTVPLQRSRAVDGNNRSKAPPSPDKSQYKKETAKPLPPAQEVASALPNLDEAVAMHVSHSYPGQAGVDPDAQVAQEIDAYIAFKGMPDSEKHMVLKYYEIGEPENVQSPVAQAIARLVKAGIKTTIVTDLNQSLDGVFPADELHNTDFEHAKYKESGPGRVLKYLRETLGFKMKYGDGKFTVLSGVPLFNPRDKSEKPLMHDKGMFALGPKGKAYEFAWTGTANMNATETQSQGPLVDYGGRYNRVLRSLDVAANQVDWDHVLAEIDAYDQRPDKALSFARGLSSDQDAPRRVTYASEEFREIAYTNGRQNPNDRITAMFEKATQALLDAQTNHTQPEFEIEEVILSQFVLTETPQVEAFRKYLDALRSFYPGDFQKRLKVFGVFDQQFISPDGWGEAAALDGLLVQRPMGKSIFPFRSEFMSMMKLFGYLRLLTNVSQVDPDAVPTHIHLWHDKTTMMKVREKDPKTGQMRSWTYAWTRSLNDSMHYQSLESQDMYRMLPDSRLAKDFEDSIKEVVKAEPQYAVGLDRAIVAVWLSHFTHHTVYDEGMLGYAEKTTDALVAKNYTLVESLLTEIAALPTRHIQAITGSDIKARIAQFVGFLNWYAQQASQDASLNELTYRKAVNIGVGLATKNAWGMRNALNILYYDPKHSPEQTLGLMRKAWTEGLHMDVPFPEPKTDGGNVS